MELTRLIETHRSAMPDLGAAGKHPGRSLESALPRLRCAQLIDYRQASDKGRLLEINLDLLVRRRLGLSEKPVEQFRARRDAAEAHAEVSSVSCIPG
jgi:hypothetical protein